MKRLLLGILLVLMLSGCASGRDGMKEALDLRQKMDAGCTFEAEITAEYETGTQTFILSCQADKQGGVTFCVVSPELISGITGRVDADGARLAFDDEVLCFEPLADGMLSPASAPWVLVHTLRCGYITSCGEEDKELLLSVDDSYENDALHLNIRLDGDNVPSKAEIIWNQRRILSMEVREFRFLSLSDGSGIGYFGAAAV